MTNCNDPRKNCGQIVPSSCVPYTGTKPDFLDEDDFPCDVNITDIVQETTDKIDEMLSDIDLIELDEQCLDFDPATVKIKELHQIEIDKICALDAQVTTLQETLDDLDIGAEIVTIDLGNMTPAPNPCNPGTSDYTLDYILQSFADTLNIIKTELGI